MSGRRYPLAEGALDRLLSAAPAPARAAAPLEPFAIGPAVLQRPPERTERPADPEPLGVPTDPGPDGGSGATEELLGELVDMVFVSADDEAARGHHEVHLVFKAEVLGGLHLKLVKMPDGMHATFVVEDAAARRAVASHLDDLVLHLRGRGFTIAQHQIELASPGG
ncbi:MAG: flagellar hook-length control protein FliK [Deltaproteobacteria bacterium]|nr:flagellar hook-length control protein FliK [Deltaproteobacteria bacterium]